MPVKIRKYTEYTFDNEYEAAQLASDTQTVVSYESKGSWNVVVEVDEHEHVKERERLVKLLPEGLRTNQIFYPLDEVFQYYIRGKIRELEHYRDEMNAARSRLQQLQPGPCINTMKVPDYPAGQQPSSKEAT